MGMIDLSLASVVAILVIMAVMTYLFVADAHGLPGGSRD
jgi:hypothetical protein